MLKFFAMFLVLYGHSIQHLSTNSFKTDPMFLVIYSFHMPLFMTLVGYFSKSMVYRKLTESLLRRMHQLILPALIGASVLFLVKYLFNDLQLGYLHQLVVSYWFLKSAFLCSAIWIFCKKLLRKAMLWVPVSLLLAFVCPVYNVSFMYPCFLFGVLLREYLKNLQHYKLNITILTGIIFAVLLYFVRFNLCGIHLLNNGGITIRILDYICRLSLGFLGSTFFIFLFYTFLGSQKKDHNIFKLSILGEDTLGIYLLQGILLETIARHYLDLCHTPLWLFDFIVTPILALIFLAICYFSLYLLKQNSIARFCLGRPLTFQSIH